MHCSLFGSNLVPTWLETSKQETSLSLRFTFTFSRTTCHIPLTPVPQSLQALSFATSDCLLGMATGGGEDGNLVLVNLICCSFADMKAKEETGSLVLDVIVDFKLGREEVGCDDISNDRPLCKWVTSREKNYDKIISITWQTTNLRSELVG